MRKIRGTIKKGKGITIHSYFFMLGAASHTSVVLGGNLNLQIGKSALYFIMSEHSGPFFGPSKMGEGVI